MCKSILHMKIDPALKELARKAAEKDNRTLSNLVETLLRQHLTGK